jgi:hypothetical protein
MTPVLLGVVFSWFFTETLGWVFAGLVVPGYLAAVFLLHPIGGVIDVIEAILTYGLARLIGEWVPRLGLTSRIFGRERFFLVVVASIAVRVVVEGILLPALLPRTPWAFTFGLVVVPLAANACWKTGLRAGAVQTAVPAVLVYLVLRFVLVRYTNFSLSGFDLATENVIASFLASPKAYILILTGAALASAANVRYGWDFNGILVPALLGLVVLEPTKLLATFAEAVVLVAIGRLAMRKIDLVGPRQTVFFFAVDYALRFTFVWFAGRALPSTDPTGLTGFGYLLPTLLAVKMIQKDSLAVVALPALKTSVAAFVLGTLLGWTATKLDPATPVVQEPRSRPTSPAPKNPTDAALWVSAAGASIPRAGVTKLGTTTWRETVDGLAKGDAAPAEKHGFVVDRLDGGILLLRSRSSSAPALLVGSAAPGRGRIVVVVREEPTHLSAALLAGHLVETGQASAVVLGGPKANADEAAEALGGRDGILVDLAPTEAGDVRVTVRDEAHASAARSLVAPLGVTVAFDSYAFDLRGESLIAIAGIPALSLDLGSAATVSALLRHVPSSGEEPSAEQLSVLRRLLSFLASERARDDVQLAVWRRLAHALGYHLSAPVPGIAGQRTVALFGDTEPRPIIVIARTDRPIRRVLEAPRALAGGTRDLALGLAVETSSDAVLFGIQAGGSTYERDAFSAAHGALFETANATIVVRHTDDDLAGVVASSGWGKDHVALEGPTLDALRRLGIPSTHTDSLDPHLREMASRTLPSGASLVALTADTVAESHANLGGQRGDLRAFSSSITRSDGAIEVVAERLAKALPERPGVELPGFISAVRSGIGERSVTAIGAMEAELATSAASAAMVTDGAGHAVLIVLRASSGLVVVVQPTNGPARRWIEATSPSAGACARAVLAGGTCRVAGS